MKLASRTQNGERHHLFGGHLFGDQGIIAHRRLARMLCEDRERLVTAAELARLSG